MFQTLKNAWKVVELKNKLLFTLLIVVLYRLGANIPVPYVSADVFESMSTLMSGTILQYLNIMSGDALSKATLFALGVSPYITASIVIQLLTVAFPKLQEWSKDGENGRKKINFLTRIVTVALALVTSIGYVYFLEAGGGMTGSSWIVGELTFQKGAVIVACYCAGASIVMWLGEKINEKGIGNGISMILFANIITSAIGTFSNLQSTILSDNGNFSWIGLAVAVVVVLVLLGFILLIVAVTDAERRIPVQYAKRVVGRKMYGGQSTNLPIKVNMSGVMPIIFANSIVAIPSTITTFTGSDGWFGNFIKNWFSYDTVPYLIVFFALLIAFAYFYVAISFNPIEVANNIKSNGGSILGIRPGKPTVDFITKILYRITLVGALFVAIIAVLPMLAVVVEGFFETPSYFAPFAFGGSSLMIVVGVILETVRDLEAQLTLRNYKGFLD